MRALLALFLCFAMGCVTNNGPNDPNDPPNDPPPSDPPPEDPPPEDPPPGPTETCLGDNNCVCPGTSFCGHTCDTGAPECHVQGSGGAVEVRCDNNAECHVECNTASSCEVDCGGSADCNVSCPDNNCTVTNCVGADCTVSCRNSEAPRTGTTATCP
jgi:hypothetical protein